ncbi:MAG TPA: hypothetical protein VHE59_13115 [Mucilaginibacter sp.]|nr:hypothetical protein [Mucilaginibacter sp.]
MRKILLTAFLISVVYWARAQNYKLYVDNNGSPTDSLKATSYVVVKQLADTGWLMQNYDLENIILQSGTFKDRNLRIQNGKFVYYRRLNFYNNREIKESLKSDTMNCITTEGSYKDGKKQGRWTDYFISGKIQQEANYKDDVLNGAYCRYNDDQTTMALSGGYAHGLREGKWEIFSSAGKLMATEKYHRGKMVSRETPVVRPLNLPKPPNGFKAYFTSELRKEASSQLLHNLTRNYTIFFGVTVEGKVIEPESGDPRQEQDSVTSILLNILKNSPLWQPGDMGDKTKPVEDLSGISVEITNGSVTIKVLDYVKAKGVYFNLAH